MPDLAKFDHHTKLWDISPRVAVVFAVNLTITSTYTGSQVQHYIVRGVAVEVMIRLLPLAGC